MDQQTRELRGLIRAIEARFRQDEISPASMAVIRRQLGTAYRQATKLLTDDFKPIKRAR